MPTASSTIRTGPIVTTSSDVGTDDWIRLLRDKWSTVPGAEAGRIDASRWLDIPDDQLLPLWRKERDRAIGGEAYTIRGWYHELYGDGLRGKRVLDVGAGLGIDALTLAQHGADVTLLDIVPDNVDLQRRLAAAMGLKTNHLLVEGLADFDRLPAEFDVIWAQGSLINAPFDVVREEATKILEHLPVGGRWIELAYPIQRWQREGQLPFKHWGEKTDGPGTPWVEWYDLDKLLRRLSPARFDVVLNLNFHNDDFIWFDLVRLK